MMMAILAAAHETTSNATANAFRLLLSNRAAWEEICENPALIPNAVEECLRRAGSIVAWRRLATAATRIGDVEIPKGARLLIVMASANHDERHFDNPDTLDLYRENSAEHLSFGYGAHQCMGKNIARMEMRIFLEEFVKRLPHMELVPDQAFTYLPNTSFRGPDRLWVRWDPANNPERRERSLLDRHQSFRIGAPVRAEIARQMRVAEIRADDRCRHGGPAPMSTCWSATTTGSTRCAAIRPTTIASSSPFSATIRAAAARATFMRISRSAVRFGSAGPRTISGSTRARRTMC
jgi:hypothetical protein